MESLVNWETLQIGQRIRFVARLVCRNLEGVEDHHLFQSADRSAQKLWVKGALLDKALVVLVGVVVHSVRPITVHVDADDRALSVPSCSQGLTKWWNFAVV